MLKSIFKLSCIALISTTIVNAQQPVKNQEEGKVYLVSNAHLDTQWNWDIQTTIKDHVWNTLSRNLYLLKKYPNYIFNFEGAVKYSWMKEYYPNEYELMKKYIQEGRWHVSGSSWEASDVLLPSIESNIRNILYGQEFYRHEFNVEGTDIFLPDCFGFGWTLPTIAKHCGLIGFSSQKLEWRSNKYPFPIGLWKGVDGSVIMMAHGFDYGMHWDNEDISKNDSLRKTVLKSPIKTIYQYYGIGDVGGSPTIPSIHSMEKGLKGTGPLKIISATSDQLYKDFLPFENQKNLPEYNGELLIDVHGTGCYTSQAAMKLYNRQNELLGDAAEKAAVMARWLGVANYPDKTLTDAWKRFLFHQFHDDLTGTSIPRAYEFSWNDELISLKDFSKVMTNSIEAISRNINTNVKGLPVLFYNPLSFPVTDIVEINIETIYMPKDIKVYDPNGNEVRSQIISYNKGLLKLLVEASAPSIGYSVYDVMINPNSNENKEIAIQGNSIENSVYKISLNPNGDIYSLYDKINKKELVKKGQVIRLAIFEGNESFDWPAWEIKKTVLDSKPSSIKTDVKMSICENGPLRKVLCIEKKHGTSTFKQYIRLYEGNLANRIDFYNEIDWCTPNALLKAEFPLNIKNKKATYDIGLGTIQRGNNRKDLYEVYAHNWADLTDYKEQYGVTIMNDCKYGWDKPNDNTLRLTLLHSPKPKNVYTYQAEQDFGHHTFTYSIIGHKGEVNQSKTSRQAATLNQRLKAFVVPKHYGSLNNTFSFVSCNNDNVVISAFKKAENSNGYVVRVIEQSGIKPQQATLTFAGKIIKAIEIDGTEKSIGEVKSNNNTLEVNISPNSIKSYLIFLDDKKLDEQQVKIISLPYNKKCFSSNEFCWDVNFESGYSYAVELIPDTLIADNIPFKLETYEPLNGTSCKGDTIKLNNTGQYNKLSLLVASSIPAGEYIKDYLVIGQKKTEINIPSYCGFIGQWGHNGHTLGFLNLANVAYIGTHKHCDKGDIPYEYTYMFKIDLDIENGTEEIILPDNENIVIFAATLSQKQNQPIYCASEMFRTSNIDNVSLKQAIEKKNIISNAKIIAYSGYVNEDEKPEYLIDGNHDTKWCDISRLPNYVDFDLGHEMEINSWKIINAAKETFIYTTNSCFLQGKNSPDEEWRTLDYVSGNKQNILERILPHKETVRYLRLLVTQPVQIPNGKDTRIYELEVYN